MVWLALCQVRYSALIRTYSALRSQVHMCDRPAPPVPRSTSISMSVALEVCRRLRRALVERGAIAEELHGSDADRRPFERERRAGPARHRDQTAPVRIAAMNRSLDERRVRNGPRRSSSIFVRLRADHTHGDQLGGTLTAPHDSDGQRLTGGAQCLDERGQLRFADGHAARTAGEQKDAIVRRAFPVNRNGVERVVHDRHQRTLQKCRLDAGVRRDESEHRRHHRFDHSRALGDSANPHDP